MKDILNRTNRPDLRTRLARWGLQHLGEVMAFEAMNRAVYLEILRVLRLPISRVEPRFLTDELPYEFRALERVEVERYAEDPTFNLHEFCRTALDNGDTCFAVLDGDQLINYGWYSHRSTPITGEFRACFHRHYVYMHHGFTHPAYRGRHLHSYCMARALQWLSRERPVELISVVSVSNIDSFKSTQRLGYEQCGKIYLMGRLNTYIVYIDSTSRRGGFWVEPTRSGYRSIFVRLPQLRPTSSPLAVEPQKVIKVQT